MANKTKIVATIEARMTSSRLPGKVLLPIGKKPALQVLVERLRRVKQIDEIVIATTVNKTDDAIEDLGKRLGVSVFRGSEEDVLGRVVGAVDSVKGDIIVEITGDCPLMDPKVVEYMIDCYVNEKYDYVTNNGAGDSTVREIPIGMDVQVFSYKNLKQIADSTTDPEDREHVSLYFYRGGRNIFKIKNAEIRDSWKRKYPVRLTLDTQEDLELIRMIHDTLVVKSEFFGLDDILTLCDKQPDILEINSAVKQKRPTGTR